MERTSSSSKRMAMPSCEARKTIWLPSVMLRAHEFVFLIDADGDDAARHHVARSL